MSIPQNMSRVRLPVVIVGGGITGLSAAWKFQSANIPYIILEASERLGGKLHTITRDGYIMELGADAILRRKPWALTLANELGLKDKILNVSSRKTPTYIMHRGKPEPMPQGMSLLVPSMWWPFLRSPLFSAWGKLRVAMEPFIPARKETTDETLASFIERRFGHEMLQKIAEPMLAGVFSGDSRQLSILATFPQFPAMEHEHGSLIRAMRIQMQKNKNQEKESAFFSFQGGTQELVDTLASKLTGDVFLNKSATRIEKNGNSYRILTSSGEPIEASGVLLATSAKVASSLLRDISPHAAEILGDFRQTSIGTAYLAYRKQDINHSLDGYGVVIPHKERKYMDGITWTSSKWAGRAPEGMALIRTFFGGPGTEKVCGLADEEILSHTHQALSNCLGISGQPSFTYIHRWQDAYPQYEVNHLDRVALAASALPAGIALAGCAYHGIGVSDCVKQGFNSSEMILSQLKI